MLDINVMFVSFLQHWNKAKVGKLLLEGKIQPIFVN